MQIVPNTQSYVVYLLFKCLPITAVTLGFESMEYSSSEADGFVNVTIVKTGSSAVNVSVVLSTEDGSATGIGLH